MAELPYTRRIIGPSSFTITPQMRFVNVSLKGRSLTASQVLSQNNIGTLPASTAIDLGKDEVIGSGDASGGFVQGLKISVPAGGIVDLFGNVG